MTNRPDAPSTAFASLAHLYAPADPALSVAVIETGPDWSWDASTLSGAEAAIWGQLPAKGAATAGMTFRAIKRELAVARLLARRGRVRVRRIHRLSPVRRGGAAKRAFRDALMGGLIVELGTKARRRTIDEVALGLGVSRPLRLRPSGDGSALARVRLGDGRVAEVRVASNRGMKDPRVAHAALQALESADVALVPRPISSGEAAGAIWTTETLLPGRNAARLEPLLAAVVELAGTFPRSAAPATSMEDNARQLGAAFPQWAETLAAAAASARRDAADLGSILVHGDLWLGNLLEAEGRLSGLIDWDTWHPAGLPGADLLHLLAMAERAGTGLDLGDLWLAGLWRRPEVDATLAGYWRALGLRPTPRQLDAIAVDWWLTQATTALRRGRRPTEDPAWVRRNIAAVVEAIDGRSERTHAG